MPMLREAFERVLASGQYILGPEVLELERRSAEIAGCKHAIGVSSGTDAILLALMALDIRRGDEVICPSFTFFATAGCVARTGATPVFVDCCPFCFNINIADARKRVSSRTRAIIPVHLFGQMAEMDTVMALAREHNLRVIEDAAQSIGASYRGRPAGSIGDFGAFSFFPSKNLGGFGDSGMLVTNDDALAQKARLLRVHGAERKYFHKLVGANFRMDPLQAALLGVKLDYLEQYSARRAANTAYYTSQFSALHGVGQPDESNCSCQGGDAAANWKSSGVRIQLPMASSHKKHIWNQYTLRVLAEAHSQGGTSPRDALKTFLTNRQIGCETYYPRPLHMQECFLSHDGSVQTLPVSEQLAQECLSLPVFPELTREQQNTVIAAIAEFLQ